MTTLRLPLAWAPGRAGRLRAYLQEMHPPLPRLAGAGVIAAGLLTLRARVDGSATAWPAVLLAAWSIAAHMLLLRLADELKDVEVDRALFPSRPLPSGRVLESDLRAALAVATVAFLVPAIVAGTLATALVVLAFTAAMSAWFFVPRLLRPRLLATLVTHQPIVPLVLLHVLGLRSDPRSTALIVGVFWTALLAWELARKIRAPQDEDAYVTYSRLFGRWGACALVLAVQLASLACGTALAAGSGVSWRLPALQLVGVLLTAAAIVRFLAHPDAHTARLREPAETALLLAAVGGVMA